MQQPAQAATLFWDLNFFDSTGTLVGNGEFTSEPDKTVVGTTLRLGSNFPYYPLIEENFEIQNYLTNFSANIVGRKWLDSSTQPPNQVTWLDSYEGTKELRSSGLRYDPNVSIANNWEIGGKGGDSPFNPIRQALFLEGKGLEENQVWGGSWLERIVEEDRGIRVIETTGTWRATVRNLQSVPEPDTVLGIATFGLACFFLRGVASSKKA
ncbi:MAG: hypothetical protein KME60_20570 [Cyanomargarita calcarea GSE-NOS-MK-12-04C]|uniref:Uncharacterized protein n=1 Tax=Cyanomargarita calcarea GSE-NOS-MK-12-04C TaxID=2839659 RepID=A0A951QNQ3_9CYAN|nr:hypothetical protein [Cyanomargarita calcarea GSE-NOS-MK-12-04C]